MLQLKDGSFLVENIRDLPDFSKADTLYLDVETEQNTLGIQASECLEYDEEEMETATSKSWSGLYPFKGDRICGYSVTADDHPNAYYIPLRHTRGRNVPLEEGQRYLAAVVGGAKKWVNHNILIDAVFAHFEGAEFGGELVDTLTAAKMIDSDRFQYGQKILEMEWLGRHRPDRDAVLAYLKGIKSKNFADAPADLLGEYGCEDVIGNRELYKFICEKMPAEQQALWETERKLTAVLYDMELEGLRVIKEELRAEQRKSLRSMIEIFDELEQLTGVPFTNSSQCVFDILCNQLGLPVLMTKKDRDENGREYDTGRPTFDKNALALYDVHPAVLANKKAKRVVELIRLYRKESQYKGLFLDSYSTLMDADERIHPTYNQLVRTGRMSCKRPNAQQLNLRAKALIHPDDGEGFMSCDYSQIEFRLMIHYIEDIAAIRAYNEHPDTDFHQWIADMLHIKRKPAKTLNFGMGYGAGKPRVTAALAANPDIIEEIGAIVNAMVEKGEVQEDRRSHVFRELCAKRASDVYDRYHETLPGIKRVSKEAAAVCRWRGYVRNAYGRRRHLPRKASHKAFNSIIQGCAMDVMKERMVALSPRYNSTTRGYGLRLAANVHDEILVRGPWDAIKDPTVQRYVYTTLESPTVQFRVPIRTGMGISRRSWAEAAGDDEILDGGEKVGAIR